jgi:uncharacterized SAM-binding protein YcdF (DUF218 family)
MVHEKYLPCTLYTTHAWGASLRPMFILSKIIGTLVLPSNLLMLALLLGIGLLFTRFHRLGRRLAAVVAVVILLLAVLPVDQMVMAVIEDRFPPPAAMPDRVDGIIVLGGALAPALSASRDQPIIKAAADRITAMVRLARRYPQARVVYSGGSGDFLDQRNREAPWVKRLLAEMGCPHESIVFEDRSRNTRENALYSAELMQPKPGETWLLVTSALHMPRSVGVFRAAGWPVIPYPVDYNTHGRLEPSQMLRFNLGAGVYGLDPVAHEVLGLVSYRMAGWSSALFPD